jgi:hypothetical protein
MRDVAIQHKYLCPQGDVEYSHKEKRKMKKILKSIYCFFESMARARAASFHARQGNYKTAQRIMGEKSQCC